MWEENQEKDLQDNRGEREPLPINGVEAVQEALERKAAEEEAERQRRLVLEEEARHRAEAAAEARRLAEENRRAAEEMNARQKAFYEKFVQHRQEQKNKRIKKMRITAAVLAGLLCLGALTFGLISYRDARTARTELAQIRQELKSVQQTAASAAELARMPGQTSADPASLAVGSAIGSLTDVSNIVEETIRSVVTINTSTKVRISTGFFGEREYTTSGAGSGVIIGDNGTELWIVTNAHVVDDANTISLILADDTEVEAYVKGTSAENDIAVLGVAMEKIPESTRQSIRTAAIGSSDTLRLGEGVVAIGNAMGWGQSVTTGVVSALSRNVKFSDGSVMNLLQISAAINPGNSGGALLNARGELIGINNAKYSSEEVEGVGFAIPISSIIDVMKELSLMEPRMKVAEEDMPYLGITFQNYPAGYYSSYNVPEGAVIYSVQEDSPAGRAGLLAYDVITAIDGHEIKSYEALAEELKYHKGGTEVEIRYMRLSHGRYEEGSLRLTLGFKSEMAP